jgi:hypothetical protein
VEGLKVKVRVVKIPPGISGEELYGKKSYWSIKGELGAEAHARRLKAARGGAYALNSMKRSVHEAERSKPHGSDGSDG